MAQKGNEVREHFRKQAEDEIKNSSTQTEKTMWEKIIYSLSKKHK